MHTLTDLLDAPIPTLLNIRDYVVAVSKYIHIAC